MTDMQYMFADAHAFDADISRWAVASVADFSGMFLDRACIFSDSFGIVFDVTAHHGCNRLCRLAHSHHAVHAFLYDPCGTAMRPYETCGGNRG